MKIKHALAAAVLGLSTALPAWASDKNIVETAIGAGEFTTLAKALEAAHLVNTLQGEGPFTVLPLPMLLLQHYRQGLLKPCSSLKTNNNSFRS